MLKNTENQRIKYIDYIKAIAMILVILGHINFANQAIKAWIYSFHMPVFFFVSGLVLREEGTMNLKRVMEKGKKYFQRLMFPYFLWAFFYAAFSFPNLVKILYGSYWSIVSAGALSSLWFLPVMFTALVLYMVMQTIYKEHFTISIKLLLAVVAVITSKYIPHIKTGYPWSMNVAIMAFAIILMGNISGKYIEIFYRFINARSNQKVLTYCGIFGITCLGTFVYQINIPDYGYTLMANAIYGNLFYFVFTFLCGVFMVVAISCIFELFFRGNMEAFLLFVGQNSLCFFVIQKPIIGCFAKLFQLVHVPEFIMLLVTLLGTLLICSLVTLFINSFLPQFVGMDTVKGKC